MKRCKPCAISYVKAFDTDAFSPLVVPEDPPVKRQRRSKIVPWAPESDVEAIYRRRANAKMWLGIGLALVVFALAVYALS
jgi:hypothetical protein